MGIQGLLGVLKSITDRVHIREYEGLRVAVDALCWFDILPVVNVSQLLQVTQGSVFMCI